MKIGIYDPYLDDTGGGEKYMLKIAECLSQENDVTVFWNNKEDFDRARDRFSLDLSRVRLSASIFSKHISFLRRAVESRKYDAMVVLSDGSIPTVFSKKLFVHVQQPIPGATANLKSKLKLARVNKIFCNSYFTKSFADHDLEIESVVIYPPVDLHPKKIKKENIILNVGRFRVRNVGIGDYKKQTIMLEVFKKMIKNGLKNWKFVIAMSINEQDEAEFEKFKAKIKGVPVELLVNKTNAELWDIYSRSKIYWHASGFGEDLNLHPEFAEHFGISTVEAMGAGCVPVIINAGGQKEIVEDGVNGFLWDTLDELTKKTLMLTRENVILDKISKEAIKRAHDFAGDRFCHEIKQLVEND